MSRALRTLAAVLALAVPAAGVAGCGGSSHKAENAYVDAVNQAQSDFAATFDRLASKISATSTPQQDVRTLQGFRGAITDAVARLRGIKPPARVRVLHARLVAALAAYDTELGRAQKAFATSDAQQVIAAETRLTSAVTQLSEQINRTIAAINGRLHG